jgi:hypothetical protein
MMRRMRLAAAAALLGALACAGSAVAGPPGKWTQVTGVGGQEDLNTLRVGLVRTADGVLHGTVSFSLSKGRHRATASKKGYAPATARARVK